METARDAAPGGPGPDGPAPEMWGLRHVWAAFGVLLLVIWFPFYAFVRLIGPDWAVIPALAVWLSFFGLAVWWFRGHPVRTFFVGVAAIVVWHAAGLVLDGLGYSA